MPTKKKSHYDAVILGGGVAGLSLARAFSKQRRSVLVIEVPGRAGGASPLAAGILDPILDIPLQSPLLDLSLRAFAQSRDFFKKIEKESGLSTRFLKTGMLYIGLNDRQNEKLERSFALQQKLGISMRRVNQIQIQRLAPGISAAAKTGIYYPAIARVIPRHFVHALRRAVVRQKTKIQKKAEVARLILKNGCAEGVCFEGETVWSPIVVNATGSWAGVDSYAGFRAPVRPARGQIVITNGRVRPSCVVHSVEDGYMVPWESGRTLLGSTVEYVGFKPQVTEKGVRSILKKAAAIFPSIKGNRVVATWAGLRPSSRDRLPMIGETPVTGYFMATAYFRSGILIADLAAKLLVQGILKGGMPAELGPFNPMRFKLRRERPKKISKRVLCGMG